MKNLSVIILAAGKGTRMGSELPKVLHQVNGKEMINRVIDTVDTLSVKIIGVVVGYQAEKVKEKISHPKVLFVMQSEQLGTGHAVMQAESAFKTCQDDEHVLIMAGDCPLIQKETLKKLYKTHINAHNTYRSVYTRILKVRDKPI